MAADLKHAQLLLGTDYRYVDEQIENIYKAQAARMLSLFRDILEQHNTGRHEIKISAAMGMASVYVDGTTWTSFGLIPCYAKRGMPIVATLNWIDNSLDWGWAGYLDGKVLNPRRPE